MASFTSSSSVVAGSILIDLAGVVLSGEAAAQQRASTPDFYGNRVGWYGVGDFMAIPGGPRPVSSNPAYPYVPNGTGRQPTYRISDVTNPNLKSWVKEFMKKDNDEVLAGKIGFTPRSSCMPAGVPAFGHVGLDLALRRAAECIGSAGYGVNNCCGRSRRVGRRRAMAGVGIAVVLERPRVIVPLQTATRDFRELE